MKIKLTIEQRIIVIAISITAFLIILGSLSPDEKTRRGVISNALILFAFMLILPFIILRYQREKAIREMEEKMPSFLRDLIEAINSGLPFHKAIISCSEIDYGELSKEVKKMANQLSWNIPVDKVLDQFIERVRSSKKLYISLKILRESYFTGGDVVSTLNSVAENLTQFNDIGKERASLLNQYVMLTYTLVFVFLAIFVAINRLMIPIFHTSQIYGETQIFTSPCANNPTPVCEIFSIPAKYLFGIEDPENISGYYISIFFYINTIIAITCGVVIGEITRRSVFVGLRHALILTIAVWGILLLLKVLNFIGA
ncbi:MAG: type II secretion system F family protein [Candidatus Aenigmatarchaeota archaeon]